jgi:hypothetical protein
VNSQPHLSTACCTPVTFCCCCRRILLLLLQFLRGRQHRADLTYPDPASGTNKTVSFADILVASGVAAVKQCSKGALIIPYTVGRADATAADDTLLPSPNDLIEQKHFEIFKNMVSQQFQQL